PSQDGMPLTARVPAPRIPLRTPLPPHLLQRCLHLVCQSSRQSCAIHFRGVHTNPPDPPPAALLAVDPSGAGRTPPLALRGPARLARSAKLAPLTLHSPRTPLTAAGGSRRTPGARSARRVRFSPHARCSLCSPRALLAARRCNDAGGNGMSATVTLSMPP